MKTPLLLRCLMPMIAMSLWPGVASSDPAPSTITLRLLNGNDGTPIAVPLDIRPHCTNNCAFPNGAVQAKEGRIEIDISSLQGLTSLELARLSERFRYCQPADDPSSPHTEKPPEFNVKDIFRTGIVAPDNCNFWLHIQPHPGELVFFMRPSTWWDDLKRGIQF